MKLRIPAFSLFSGLSVFVKSCLLIAVTTLVVAGSLTYQNDKTFRAAVEKGVRTLGAGVTITVAAQSGGAIRFGDTNRLAADIQKIIDLSEGRALAGIAVNKKGKVISTAGEISEADLEKLAAIGHTAAESGVFEQSPNGYFVAAPAAAGADGSVIVGSIAMIWSPEVAFAEAAFDEMMSYVFAAAAFVIMCTLSVLALRSILSRPLAETTHSIEVIADGDYDSEVPYLDRRDEIGRIAKTLDHLKDQLAAARGIEEQNKAAQTSQKHVVDTLTEALSSLSKGNLTHNIDSPFAEKYEPLRENYNAAVTQMVTIIEAVIENSSRIRASAEEISQSSNDLSQRTESQAATLEETAAAMEELTVSVKSAAEGAKEVEGIVTKAQDTAKRSGQVVTDAVNAMAQIESSSAKISQIIGVIDDISFQTNLLALNAGVEAARAGEAGRGFAVVASEVRALAQRSSDAAQEIKQLIAESTQHVNTGVDLVGKAGDELEQIIDRVGTISSHITSIAAGAEEQSTALSEINTGVSQLDQVTQHNAAMVEESTAASQILRNDATELARQVSVFQTGSNSSVPVAPPASSAPTAHPALGQENDDFFADPSEGSNDNALPKAVGWEDF